MDNKAIIGEIEESLENLKKQADFLECFMIMKKKEPFISKCADEIAKEVKTIRENLEQLKEQINK